MTTYTYDAFYFEFDNNDNVANFRASEISLVTAPSVTSLTYQFGAGVDQDGLRPIEPATPGTIYTLLIDGQANQDEAATIARVTWASGGQSFETFLLIVTDQSGGDHAVFLGGAQPNIQSAADFETFNARITGVANVTNGAFGPGSPIDLTAIPTLVISEDDLIVGFEDDDTLNGGIGNDTILAGAGNDQINPGTGEDYVLPGTGNDTVILTELSDPLSYFSLGHDDLNNAIAVQIDAIDNTGFINKFGSGTTTLVDVAAAASGEGMGVSGTNFGDSFTVSLDTDQFLSIRPLQGNDTITVANDNLGYVRLDYRPSASGIQADLGARTVINDGFTDTIVGNFSELRATRFDDTVTGSSADEAFTLLQGSDTLDGGGGFDLVRYDRNDVADLVVDLEAGTATGTWGGVAFAHTVSNVEYVRGTRDGTNDRISGSSADERIRTYAGNDTIEGRGGNDTIEAGGGIDTAILGASLADITQLDIDGFGALVIFTAQGISSYYQVERFNVDGVTYTQQQLIDAVAALPPAEGPTQGDDTIVGDGDDNVISALGGDDVIDSGAGNDTVDGGAGTDTAILNVDFDGVQSATRNPDGSITITTANGTSTYTSVELFDLNGVLVTGDALLNGPPSTEPSTGGDLLTGGTGADRVDGGDGNDTINGGDGPDGLKGSDGDDLLVGGPGDDRLPGGGGNDTIIGNDGNDNLGGGDGNDRMVGGDGNDRGGAGAGDDTILGGDGNDVFNGGQGNDYIDMGAGNDRSGGSFTNDTIFGGSGNDTLGGGEGFDLIYGGSGDDDIGAGGFDDTVYGGTGDDFIGGGDGDDTLMGEDGNDTINSGYGNDTVNGGAGADQFVFNALSGGGITVIEDFEDGIDEIRVTGLRNPADPLARLDITDITYDGQQAVTMRYGDHTVIVLGAESGDFTTDDFLFV